MLLLAETSLSYLLSIGEGLRNEESGCGRFGDLYIIEFGNESIILAEFILLTYLAECNYLVSFAGILKSHFPKTGKSRLDPGLFA